MFQLDASQTPKALYKDFYKNKEVNSQARSVFHTLRRFSAEMTLESSEKEPCKRIKLNTLIRLIYVLTTAIQENKSPLLAHCDKPHLKQESPILSNYDLKETKILELERTEDTHN